MAEMLMRSLHITKCCIPRSLKVAFHLSQFLRDQSGQQCCLAASSHRQLQKAVDIGDIGIANIYLAMHCMAYECDHCAVVLMNTPCTQSLAVSTMQVTPQTAVALQRSQLATT